MTANTNCKKTETIFSKFTLGAIITGKNNFKYGDVLHIGVGQKGSFYGGGSGGTFICRQRPNGSFEPFVIAGGAGGYYHKRNNQWSNASINEFGNGSKSGERNNNIGGSGESGFDYYYNGGAGYKTNAPNARKDDPKCFQDGLQGGYYQV